MSTLNEMIKKQQNMCLCFYRTIANPTLMIDVRLL
jgi:hypothetical protein